MANTDGHYKIVSKEEFDKIKQLTGLGVKPKQIQEILGNNRSAGTIGLASRFSTLEEYRKHLRECKARSLAKKRLQTKPPVLVKTSLSDVLSATTVSPVLVKTSLSDVLSATTVSPVPMFEFRDVPQSNPEVILTRIAMAIERLADVWEATPTKRRLF